LPTALNNVLSQAALSLDKTAAWIASDVAQAAALVGVAVILVPRFGSLGLALGYLAGMIVTCAVLAGPVARGDRRTASHRSPMVLQ
jgi:O-antigen/teichoic acid export membrane protein